MPMGKISKHKPQTKVTPTFRKKVQKIINVNLEKKFFTHGFNSVQLDSTGVNYTLLPLAQGDSQFTRTGNMVRMMSYYMKIVVQPSPNTVLTPALYDTLIRLVVYIPKDTDDVLSLTNIGEQINQDNFNVIYDKFTNISIEQGAKTYIISKSFNKKGTRAGVLTHFNGTASTDLSKNNIKFYVGSNQSLSTETPLLSGSLRSWYTDA